MMAEPDATAEKPADTEATTAFGPDAAASELVRVLEGCMADLQAGRRPDREKLLAEHPALAGQLEQCLASIEFIHAATEPGSGAPAQLGDFRIVREIGHGGMGVVYEAEQLSLKRKVALKVLRFGGATDPEAMRRFQDEAETIARLHHTNIVPIFAVGCQQSVHYYAMQFIEGRGLDAVLQESNQRSEPLAPDDVARWGLQAAEALVHAHQRGVIHRDVKPSNLLLDPDGTLWLTDFGLAKREDEITQTVAGVLMGTPRYMSPEQASAVKKPVDQRTDVYSLGATLYELATGRPIFEADTPHGVISQILSAEPEAPRRLNPSLPRDLETIILKCVAKEPSHRYPTAQELADDLRAFAEGRSIKARRAGLVERTVRRVRKQRRSVGLAAGAAAIAVLLVVGAILGWQWHRQAQMGQIRLSTDGPSLVADVLDADDDPAVPSFPVPTPEPVTLPAGSYQLRLSAPGVLSETWPLEVTRLAESGGPMSQCVNLEARWLWPPPEVWPVCDPEVMDLAGRPDLIVTEMFAQPNRVILRRLDGATGKPVWPSDLVLDKENLPAGSDEVEWIALLQPATMMGWPTLLQPPPDLDGDGTRDLVWASRASPSLLATSGNNGKVLWWFRARPNPTEAVDPSRLRPLGSRSLYHGGTLGRPIAADVDADGTPDLIACFVTAGETFADEKDQHIDAEPQEWLEAVSGRTGKSLWRYRMDKHWLDGKYSFDSRSNSEDFHLNCVLAVVQTKGQPLMAMVAGRMLVALDLKTGKEAWPPEDLGFDPIGLPQWADLDGDGRSELLVLRPKLPVPVPGRAFNPNLVTELLLSAVSLSARRPIWETALRPALTGLGELQQSTPERPAVYWVADLDQDGKPEVMIPVGRHGGSWYWDAAGNSSSGRGYDRCHGCWSGVDVLDGVSGNRRWQRPLWYTGASQPPAIHGVIAGPDLDGDGSRELFVAAVGYDPGLDKESLTVVAISTVEGRVLWRWRQAGGHDLRPLRWWQAGQDGWPQLVVPAESGPGGQPVTYVLSAATGRLAHVLAETCVREAADFNGDGIADLCCWQFFSIAAQSGAYGAKLAVIPGALPEPWRQFGTWKAAEDFDGDGFTDLINCDGSALAARSGRDGRRLWQTEKTGWVSSSSLQQAFLSPPIPEGDLDADGCPDIVRFDEARKANPDGRSSRSYLTVSAFSGKDGHRLWTAPDFGIGSSVGGGSGPWLKYSYPMLASSVLDGDGQAEVLVAYYATNQTTHLAALSGRDGTLRWKVPFLKGGFGGPHGFPRGTVLKDLNGDGVLDLVLWVPKDGAPCEVGAFSGNDGSELWPSSAAKVQAKADICPPPTAGDLDGDGIPEVVVFTGDTDADFRPQVLALGGRDGQCKWTWSWRGGFSQLLPPLLVDFHGDGRRSVCLGLYENESPQIVILNGEGRPSHRIPLDLSWLRVTPGLDRVYPWWAHADLDGDGKEELLFASDGHLWASRGSPQENLWKWPIPSAGNTGPGEIVKIQPAGKDRPATVVVWVGTVVYGLAGPTGLPRWRCDVPRVQTSERSSAAPTVQLLATDDLAGLPRILCRRQVTALDYRSTVVRQAWPIRPDGLYRAPTPVAMSYQPEPPLIPPGQPLPWAKANWWDTVLLPALGLLCFVVVVVPGFVVYRFAGGHAWAAGLAAIVYGMVGVLAMGDIFPALPLAILLVLAVPGQLTVGALRRKSLQLWLLAMTAIAASLGTFLYKFRTSSYPPLRHMDTLSGLGELAAEAVALGIGALPTVFLIFLLIGWFRRRAWKKLTLLLGWSVVLAAVIAAVLLLVDLWDLSGEWVGWRDPSQPYSWQGWYLVWPLGVYAAGTLMLLWIVLKAGFRLLRRVAGRLWGQLKPA